jgi:alpha-methylacyl-CoA racemase
MNFAPVSRYMLDDITVLDLSIYLPGSYASLLLADLGAEVVKVERPPAGEITREWEPKLQGEGHRFLQRNRNKKSICLDLKSERGLDVFYDLVTEADVVIEGFRPGTLTKLGAGYEDIAAINPEILYCSITGFGQEGALADKAGHDINYSSHAGVLGTTMADGRPVVPGVPLGDFAGGLFAAFSVVSAIQGRNQYGGQHIDISITDVLFSWLISHAGEYFGSEGKYNPGDAITSGNYPCYGVYATADGRYLTLGAIEFEFWKQFCELTGLEELIDTHLDEHTIESRRETIQQKLVTKTRAEWLELFEGKDLPITPVNSLEEAFSSSHVQERNLMETIQFDNEDLKQIKSPFGFSEFSPAIESAPPRLGADNDSVLADVGYDKSEIEGLTEDGVIR